MNNVFRVEVRRVADAQRVEEFLLLPEKWNMSWPT